MPSGQGYLNAYKDRLELYLNPQGLQFGKQLGRALMMNHMHSKAAGIFQVDGTVVDEHALFGGRWVTDRAMR